MSFCILPPESRATGKSASRPVTAPRTSNLCAMACACTRAERERTKPHFLKPLARVLSCSLTAFSQNGKSAMSPVPLRSSGIRATPICTQPAAPCGAGEPCKSKCPLRMTNIPQSNCASANCPLPDTPAIPVIWPACRVKDTSRNCSRFVRWALTFFNSQMTARDVGTERERLSDSEAISWPTIASASFCWLTSFASACMISFPCRSTATRSLTRSTSGSLWLMKIMLMPCVTSMRSVSNNASLSCGVSTAVGSSKIKTLAPRYSAFKISTRCFCPTERLPTRASGSIFKPNCSAADNKWARAALFLVVIDQRLSVPSITLSSTDKFSAKAKC